MTKVNIVDLYKSIEHEYNNELTPCEKLEWWEEYLGKEKVHNFIIDLLFDNPDEMYNDEIVIEEIEKFYDLNEMLINRTLDHAE